MGEPIFPDGIAPCASSLKPACVILFSGLTDLERRIQETLDSFWTRCALVVRGPRDTPVLLQATSRPISKDLIDGQLRTGVQIVGIDDVLAHFHGYVSMRAIRPDLARATDAALAAFATAKHGIPFNMSPFYALRAARRRNQAGDGKMYYCTELVAAALQHVGVLAGPPSGRSASNYVPGDFAESSQDLCLTGNHGFLGQQVLKLPISSDPCWPGIDKIATPAVGDIPFERGDAARDP
jgi:hypothetical protein